MNYFPVKVPELSLLTQLVQQQSTDNNSLPHRLNSSTHTQTHSGADPPWCKSGAAFPTPPPPVHSFHPSMSEGNKDLPSPMRETVYTHTHTHTHLYINILNMTPILLERSVTFSSPSCQISVLIPLIPVDAFYLRLDSACGRCVDRVVLYNHTRCV